MKIKIGIIFGGKSVEHEVSIISALQAINNIDKEKYEVTPIYIDKNSNWFTGSELLTIDSYKDTEYLYKNITPITLCNINGEFTLLKTKGLFKKVIDKIDIAFPIVHGANVEDGSIQGYLNMLDIPTVGSNIIASAISQDKVMMKKIFKSENIPIVDYTWFYDFEYNENKENIIKTIEKIKYPVIIKPANLGSSVGISLVNNKKELEEAIEEAILYDKKILVEKAVQKLTEVNISVLGNKEYQEVSVIEEVLSTDEFLTYKDKYLGGSKSKGIASTNRIMPARITEEQTKEISDIAIRTFKALNMSGIVRIDFLIDNETQNIYVNEPNIIPGSLSYYLWEKQDKTYKKLLDELITLGIKEYKSKSKKTVSFDTNILQNFNGTKGSKGKLKL